MKHIKGIPETVMTKPEQLKMLREYRETGNYKVKETLTLNLLKLAIDIINKEFAACGFEHEDLFQEASLGISEAIEKFSFEKGDDVPLYAACWIKNKIRRFILNNYSVIRLPAHVVEKVRKAETAAFDHLEKTGEEMPVEKAAEKLGIPAKNLEIYLDCVYNKPVSFDGMEEGKDGGLQAVGYQVECPQTMSPDEELSLSDDIGVLKRSFKDLGEDLREVLSYRFALNGYPRLTFIQIAEKMNCSPQWVHVLENRGKKELKTLIQKNS